MPRFCELLSSRISGSTALMKVFPFPGSEAAHVYLTLSDGF